MEPNGCLGELAQVKGTAPAKGERLFGGFAGQQGHESWKSLTRTSRDCQGLAGGNRVGQRLQSFSLCRIMSSGKLMYSTVTIVKCCLYLNFAKKVDLQCSYTDKKRSL